MPPGDNVVHIWYEAGPDQTEPSDRQEHISSHENATRLPVKSMKRVTELKNGQILFFSDIVAKDDGLKIMCQAYEKDFGVMYPGNGSFGQEIGQISALK